MSLYALVRNQLQLKTVPAEPEGRILMSGLLLEMQIFQKIHGHNIEATGLFFGYWPFMYQFKIIY